MKKSIIVVIIIAIIILLGVVGYLAVTKIQETPNINSEEDTDLVKFETTADFENVIAKVHEKAQNQITSLETREVELDDNYGIETYTGLKTAEKIEKLVVSEPMISSQAYTLAMVKIKSGEDAASIAQEMANEVDLDRWICVSADIVYATNYGDVVFLVMASKETAKAEFDAFKEIVGNKTGKDIVREHDEIELPPEIISY